VSPADILWHILVQQALCNKQDIIHGGSFVKVYSLEGMAMRADTNQNMEDVLRSAARLQTIVPGAVLVGGSAASIHAEHRLSEDHDHVLQDLSERFNTVFEALAADLGWEAATAREGNGSLDGIEAGIRQLRREKPLETEEYVLDPDNKVVIPTLEEALRIKAYFIVNRNQVRDYLDVVALTDKAGAAHSAKVLLEIDDYYSDLNKYTKSISSELVDRLSDPSPKDRRSIDDLENYKGIAVAYQDWMQVVAKSKKLALEMIKNA